VDGEEDGDGDITGDGEEDGDIMEDLDIIIDRRNNREKSGENQEREGKEGMKDKERKREGRIEI